MTSGDESPPLTRKSLLDLKPRFRRDAVTTAVTCRFLPILNCSLDSNCWRGSDTGEIFDTAAPEEAGIVSTARPACTTGHARGGLRPAASRPCRDRTRCSAITCGGRGGLDPLQDPSPPEAGPHRSTGSTPRDGSQTLLEHRWICS